jgi:hypothetical protein
VSAKNHRPGAGRWRLDVPGVAQNDVDAVVEIALQQSECGGALRLTPGEQRVVNRVMTTLLARKPTALEKEGFAVDRLSILAALLSRASAISPRTDDRAVAT